jgi:conjugative transposon TraJ protein
MFNIDFEKTFHDLFDKLSVNITDIGSIVAGIIGIGALFYFASKTWSALARNESIDIYPLLKPLVIIFLCLNFYTIVVTPMHYILSPLRTYTAKLAKDVKSNNKVAMDAIWEKSKEKRKQESKVREALRKSRGGIRKAKYGVIGAILPNVADYVWTEVAPEVGEIVLQVLLQVLSLARDIIYFIINCLRLFFLIILGMIGPIAFALSLFPSFENSLSNWFAKYVSIYLWAPVCNIVSIILSQIELLMTESLVFSNSSDSHWSVSLVLIIFYVIGIGCYLSVPTIATWAVQGGASAMELSSTLQSARKSALLAGGIAAAGSGKIAGGAKSIMGSAKNIIVNNLKK